MAMPNDLVFVRHGESEANIVQHADKGGRLHESRVAINARPDWEQRLSGRGIEQAGMAKAWMDQHLGGAASFDLRYFSAFLRTRETPAYLGGADCGDWITYLGDTIGALRADGIDVSDETAAHLTPAQHDHINFYGTYPFDIDAELRRDGHRPLRIPA